MKGDAVVRADLTAGAVRLTLSVSDYEYGSTATGSDANWLDAAFEMETPEVAARRRCLLFAGAVPSLRQGLVAVEGTGFYTFENLEHDFRLEFRHGVDGTRVQATIWLSAGAEGQLVVGATVSHEGIQNFIAALDDIIAVYPPRS